MKKNILLLCLSFFLLTLNRIPSVIAQETFNCIWNWSGALPQDCSVDPNHYSCRQYPPVGSPEQNYCLLFTDSGDCDLANGYCQTCNDPSVCYVPTPPELPESCPVDYIPSNFNCVNPLANCCWPSNQPTPTPIDCYRCYITTPLNRCVAVNPPQPGDCSPFFENENVCIANCNTPQRYNCIDSEGACTPAGDTGEFENWSDCNSECGSTCTGYISDPNGTPGICHFLKCPDGTFLEGFNPNPPFPPFEDRPSVGCSLLRACCTQPSPEWLERNALHVECTTPNGATGINTATGCIPVNTQTGFLSFILPWAIGVGGGTAFILIIVAGYLIMTSGGDPQRAKAGKDLLGSAIAGLLMIIFSVYILDLIGIKIFRIPGL